MRKFEKMVLLLLTVVLLFSCSKEYDDSELRGRIENLESWQKTVNGQIVALQGLITALENKDHVTSVTELADKSGYTITFSQSSPITIKHGQKGADGTIPVIGVKQDTDGKYYWTLDGKYLTEESKKIPATGDKGEIGEAGSNGVAPQVRIKVTTNIWEISIDGGTNWTPTGVKATGDKGEQGDAIFSTDGIDYTSDPNNVTFTLADGTTTITFPRTSTVTVGFVVYTPLLVLSDIPRHAGLTMSGITEKEFVAITATIEHEEGSTTQVQTRSVAQAWQVSITKPIFENGTLKSEPVIEVKVNSTVADNTQAILTVSVLTTKGEKISSSRILRKVDSENFLVPIENDGKISDMTNLLWLSKQLEDGTLDTKGKVYTLTCDIDMAGMIINPIGSMSEKAFKGTFDGQGHTIKNYVINNSGTTEVSIGLFGVSTGIIMNLDAQGDVKQAVSNDDVYGVGGILGVNLNGGKILNCSFSGNVSSTDCMFVSTGGVVGLNQDGLVAGCSYRAATGKKVTANDGQNCGGVIGSNSSVNATAYTIGCYNSGQVSPAANCWNLGGVVGSNYSNTHNKSLMLACYNIGVVSGATSTSTGGVAGSTSNGSLTACYNTQDITATGSHTPYLIANGDNSAILNNCFWLVSSQASHSPNILPENLINSKVLSAQDLNSDQTVNALNAAIDEWNATNGNLCNYKFIKGDQYPVLVNK